MEHVASVFPCGANEPAGIRVHDLLTRTTIIDDVARLPFHFVVFDVLICLHRLTKGALGNGLLPRSDSFIFGGLDLQYGPNTISDVIP